MTSRCATQFVLLAALGTAVAACGDEGGLRSKEIQSTEVGRVLTGGLYVVSMPVEAAPLMEFAMKMQMAYGNRIGEAGFRVVSVKIAVNAQASSGAASFEEAFNGEVEVRLKPAMGTEPGVVVGKISSPTGGALRNVPLSSTRSDLERIRSSILGASLLMEVSGPTPWNPAETRKLALFGRFQLEAIAPP